MRTIAIAAVAMLLGVVPSLAAGDPAAGKTVFMKCAACHNIGPDAKNKVGPALTGVVGRQPGTFADYNYSVTPAGSLASGLPVFKARGGFNKVGARLLLGFDLDGDITNGGPAVFVVAGYTRMLGDAKRTPLTSIRGSADQLLGVAGFAYTF